MDTIRAPEGTKHDKISLRRLGCPQGTLGFASPDCSGFAFFEEKVFTYYGDIFANFMPTN
jgi:hypothetical protein